MPNLALLSGIYCIHSGWPLHSDKTFVDSHKFLWSHRQIFYFYNLHKLVKFCWVLDKMDQIHHCLKNIEIVLSSWNVSESYTVQKNSVYNNRFFCPIMAVFWFSYYTSQKYDSIIQSIMQSIIRYSKIF